MNYNDFTAKSREAIKELNQMNDRRILKEEPPEIAPKSDKQNENSLLGDFKLPFLEKIKNDSDVTLILGIVLLLLSEKADKRLLFALIYILL